MEPWTVLDCFDALWIDFHWLALDIYPLDGAFVAVNSCMKRAAVTSSASENWEGKNIKKTQIRWVYCHGNYLFSPRWSLSLLLRHSPHFPFVASLKSAPCSEPQAATREMVNELQTLFWQYFFFFFFFLKIFHLCWPTLLFFLQSTFLPGPLAASEAAMGTTGQPGESLRSLTRPDCWLRHTTERFRYAIWQRVTATSCLIYTVQHYRCHDYNVDSHPFEQFRHSRLWLHPLNVT